MSSFTTIKNIIEKYKLDKVMFPDINGNKINFFEFYFTDEGGINPFHLDEDFSVIAEAIQRNEVVHKEITNLTIKRRVIEFIKYLKNIKIKVESDDEEFIIDDEKKVKMLCKLPQSGKTKRCLEYINDFIKINKKLNPLAIFISNNSTILQRQLAVRAESEDWCKNVKITCYASYEDEFKSLENKEKEINGKKYNLEHKLENGDFNLLTVCGNNKRFQDINTIITNFNTNRPILICIDEADYFCNGKMVKFLVEWSNIQNVEILLITATPIKVTYGMNHSEFIGKKFGSVVDILPISEKYGEKYMKFSDCKTVIFEASPSCKKPSDYVDEFFKNSGTKYLKNGSVALIPGTVKTYSHIELIEQCKKEIYSEDSEDSEDDELECRKLVSKLKNSKLGNTSKPLFNSILLLNGDSKLFYIYDDINRSWYTQECSKLPDYNCEISVWLGNFYEKCNGIEKWRLAITGNRIVGRGLTFSSPKCKLTHGIFYNCSKQIAEMYQMVCRLCGYCTKEITVIMQKHMYDKMIHIEKIIEYIVDKGVTAHNICKNISITNEEVEDKFNQLKIELSDEYKNDDWEFNYKNFEGTDYTVTLDWQKNIGVISPSKPAWSSNYQKAGPYKGYYLCSLTKTNNKLEYRDVQEHIKKVLKGVIKKTSLFDVKKAKVGTISTRSFISYKNGLKTHPYITLITVKRVK